MGREIELTCPSGLSVRFRGIKGKDLDGLRDKRRLATGEAISQLLNDCTLEVIDRSIYEKLPSFHWADCLVGDRMFAIVKLREVTSGGTFDFHVRCQDKACRQRIDWSLELKDLKIKALSASSAEIFLGGNTFETEIAGTVVKFRLNTGRSQMQLMKYMQQLTARGEKPSSDGSASEGRALLGLSSKIVSIDGVTNVLEWLGDQELADITKLAKSMDAVDCGVETTIDVVCMGTDGCGLTQAVELPLDSTFFSRPI